VRAIDGIVRGARDELCRPCRSLEHVGGYTFSLAWTTNITRARRATPAAGRRCSRRTPRRSGSRCFATSHAIAAARGLFVALEYQDLDRAAACNPARLSRMKSASMAAPPCCRGAAPVEVAILFEKVNGSTDQSPGARHHIQMREHDDRRPPRRTGAAVAGHRGCRVWHRDRSGRARRPRGIRGEEPLRHGTGGARRVFPASPWC